MRCIIDLNEGSSVGEISRFSAKYSFVKLKVSTETPKSSATTPSVRWRLRISDGTAVIRLRTTTLGVAETPDSALISSRVIPKAIYGSSNAYTCHPKSSATQVLSMSCRKRPFCSKTTIPWKTRSAPNISTVASLAITSLKYRK